MLFFHHIISYALKYNTISAMSYPTSVLFNATAVGGGRERGGRGGGGGVGGGGGCCCCCCRRRRRLCGLLCVTMSLSFPLLS